MNISKSPANYVEGVAFLAETVAASCRVQKLKNIPNFNDEISVSDENYRPLQ